MSGVDVLLLLDVAYGSSKEQRTEATQQLENALTASPHEHTATLLACGSDLSVAPEKSLSALLYLKNYVMHSMKAEVFRGTSALESLKQSLLQSLAVVSEKHRRVILEIVKTFVSEFGWNYFPQILPSIVSFDTAQQPVALAQALLETTYVLTRRFKQLGLEPMDKKLEVSCLLCESLPKFFALNDLHTFHITFKIFECATETFQQLSGKQSAHLPISTELFSNWLSYLGQFPQQFHGLAVAAGGAVYEEYVACVKRIGAVCFSILHDATKKKKASAASQFFLQQYSSAFLQMWQQWLSMCLQSVDRAIHRKSEIFAIRFIKMATLDERLFRQDIQPKALSIIEHQLFPHLCLTETDEDIFNDVDALQEYAQYILDENLLSGEFSQRQAASNAILAMVSGKKEFHDASLIHGILGIIHSGLSQDDTTKEIAKRTFGFLHLLAILRKSIQAMPDVWQQMETVMSTLIATRITSRFVFVRCKAIYVCQKYCKIPWRDENHFHSFISAVSALVKDSDARVRLSTIDSMCTFLEMKRARPYLRHILVPLVNESLYFLEKVQTTYVPLVLNYLAEHFAAELTPVLDRLVASLVQQFLAAMFDMKSQEQQDAEVVLGDEGMKTYETLGLSAYQSMSAINNIVVSTEYNKAALATMLPDVMRLLKGVFQDPDSFEFMDKAIEIFQHVVFMTKPVPQECWDLFPVVYSCVMSSGTGVDYFAKFEGVMDNFVSNSPEVYFSNQDVMRMTYEMCEKMLVGGVVANDEDVMAPPQLIEALLHQAKHCSNPALFAPYLSNFVTLILRALANPDVQQRGVMVKMWLITAMMDAFYYDASATLSILLQTGAYPHFFVGYFDFFSAIVNPDAANAAGKKKKKQTAASEVVEHLTILLRKVNILGLTSLLLVVSDPTSPLSGAVEGQYVALALRMIRYCLEANLKAYTPRCKNLEDAIEKINSAYEEEKEEEYDEDDVDLDDADDDEADLANADNDEEIEEDDDDADGEGVESTDDYYTPVDQVCEVAFFKQWLNAARSVSSPHVSHNLSVIPVDQQLDAAETVSATFIKLLAALHAANEQDHLKRAASVAAGSV